MPFPQVAPEMSAAEVAQLAEEYADSVVKMYGSAVTVHVMGEMTFTHALVSRLKAQGIRCVASTTERHVRMEADRTKVSEFRFVQFREY